MGRLLPVKAIPRSSEDTEIMAATLRNPNEFDLLFFMPGLPKTWMRATCNPTHVG